MYYDTIIEFEYEIMMDIIEKEMHIRKAQALKDLSSVVHSKNPESFANILAYSWFDSLPDAEKIAEELNLGKLDFLAIQGDLDVFKEEYLINHQEAQNF